MVGWFIQKQDVGLLKQQSCQSNARALAAAVYARSVLLHFPVPALPLPLPPPPTPPSRLRVAWPHRWEHDKGPAAFFEAVLAPGVDCEVCVLGQAFADRNVQLCAIISVLLVSYLVCCWAFMPLYLMNDRHFDADTTKWLMATLGISAGIGSFVVAALSDRIGRKPAIVGFSLLGVIRPLGLCRRNRLIRV